MNNPPECKSISCQEVFQERTTQYYELSGLIYLIQHMIEKVHLKKTCLHTHIHQCQVHARLLVYKAVIYDLQWNDKITNGTCQWVTKFISYYQSGACNIWPVYFVFSATNHFLMSLTGHVYRQACVCEFVHDSLF